MRSLFALCALALLPGNPAAAQSPEFARRVTALAARETPPAPAELAAAALEIEGLLAKRDGECTPASVAMETPVPATADRTVLAGIEGGTVRGGWTAYATPQGCPAAVRSLYLVMRLPDARVIARRLVRGETLGNLTLLHDTNRIAALLAGRAFAQKKADCADVPRLVGTRVTARGANLGPDFYGVRMKGDWSEQWTLSACGARVDVPITFHADGEGGAVFQARDKGLKPSGAAQP